MTQTDENDLLKSEQNKTARSELTKVVREFVDYSDWCYLENEGNYSIQKAQGNTYITGKKKSSVTSSIFVGGLQFGWNFDKFWGGTKLWSKGFVDSGDVNIVYDRSDESQKKLRVEKHIEDSQPQVFATIPLGSLTTTDAQIEEIVNDFWEFEDQINDSKKEINDKISYKNQFSNILLESKNIIFRGAPGTGKTYLANEIAADIVSDGKSTETKDLTDEEKSRIGFVQFHPSYDYTDFVEGLRPKINDNGSMGFELQDGVFKKFVSQAQANLDNSQKSKEDIQKEATADNKMDAFFENIEFGGDTFSTVNGSKFTIAGVDDRHIRIDVPGNKISDKVSLNIHELQSMLTANQDFKQVKDVNVFFGKPHGTQQYSYDLALYKKIKIRNTRPTLPTVPPKKKNFVFIIDEINRGEISKIFGELFFAIDPGYRGTTDGVLTQYANLHDDPESKFSIPENVYIIGTMNDIDRSVDSFDFAMRRRFRFIEIKAQDNVGMLDELDEPKRAMAIQCMQSLNNEIACVDGLNENYAIGPAYFLKLQHLTFNALWNDYLQPLLQDYVRGMNNEEGIMQKFEAAYTQGYQSVSQDNVERPADPDGNSLEN
ncbi:Endonuclease [Oenococcus oeni]|uniref:McrB family protein n=1 Tax=Oenococcus oeni TaxID=1247 RepID=UPI0010B909C4|nr:AAA family ATPase [Oenococcus oeni]SYW00392.1 Endonuclease [Oenococcus oeni]SYW07248.1 Endonuclease [Oenococcus oeni]